MVRDIERKREYDRELQRRKTEAHKRYESARQLHAEMEKLKEDTAKLVKQRYAVAKKLSETLS